MNQWRQPLSQVLCDGELLPGILSWRVSQNSNFSAGSWTLTTALNADPIGLGVWDQRTNSLFEVSVGIGGGSTSLITGQADNIVIDQIAGIIRIEGRDLTSRFLAARTSETFANQTSSQVAAALAQRQGLSADITPTTTPIGRFYGSEHDRVTLDRYARTNNEWDLLALLADHEGFSVYVSGTTLFFSPLPASIEPALILSVASDGPITPNVKSLHLDRAYTLSGPISVTVKSWSSQNQASFTQTVNSPGNNQGPPASYVFMRPNLTSGQALSLANQKLTAITSHQYVLTAELPGELNLTAYDTISLVGTNSSFDRNYSIETITRTFDFQNGFNEIIRARSS